MTGLLRAEFYRWRHSPVPWVTLAVFMALDVANYAMAAIFPHGGSIGPVVIDTGIDPSATMMFILFDSATPAAILAALLIGSAFAQGTPRMAVALGYPRVAIFGSRLVTMSVWWALFVIANGLASAACLVVFGWWGASTPEPVIVNAAYATGLQILFGLTFIAIFTAVAFLVKNAVATIAAYIAWSIVAGFIATVAGGKAAWVLVDNYGNAWIAALLEEQEQLWPGLGVCLSWTAAAVIIGCVCFHRIDLK